MILHDVNSSFIRSIGYDPQQQKLMIIFQNGKAFLYDNVEYDVYNKFINSESLGRFFHKYIKNFYTAIEEKIL